MIDNVYGDRRGLFEEVNEIVHNAKNKTFVEPFCQEFQVMVDTWRREDRDFTKILTFLIGFYVSFTARSWLKQIESLPKLDGLSLVLGSISNKTEMADDNSRGEHTILEKTRCWHGFRGEQAILEKVRC